MFDLVEVDAWVELRHWMHKRTANLQRERYGLCIVLRVRVPRHDCRLVAPPYHRAAAVAGWLLTTRLPVQENTMERWKRRHPWTNTGPSTLPLCRTCTLCVPQSLCQFPLGVSN